MRKDRAAASFSSLITHHLSLIKMLTLVLRNLSYYRRTNAAVVFGVGVAVAVLAGAPLVGGSGRASLRGLFLQRLGRATHVASAPNYFREALAQDVSAGAGFKEAGFDA